MYLSTRQLLLYLVLLDKHIILVANPLYFLTAVTLAAKDDASSLMNFVNFSSIRL